MWGKKYQHQTKVELIANYKVWETKLWMYIQIGNKGFKSLLASCNALPAGGKKWNQKYEDLNWKNIFKINVLKSPLTLLQQFQLTPAQNSTDRQIYVPV